MNKNMITMYSYRPRCRAKLAQPDRRHPALILRRLEQVTPAVIQVLPPHLVGLEVEHRGRIQAEHEDESQEQQGDL